MRERAANISHLVAAALTQPTSGGAAASRGVSFVTLALGALWLGDALLSLLIVRHVAYTEIDFSTYMQQVEVFLGGERDYSNIAGDTGPCVYPAAFLYIYWGLHSLTSAGADILTGQLVFVGLYLATLLAVMAVYRMGGHRVPLWAIALLLLSKRIHSIYMLRLFNDGCAVLLAFLAVALFQRAWWNTGCITFSLAVGVKMNILLFAPGLLLLLLQAHGVVGAALHIAVCAIVQLLIGLPFLAAHPVAYIRSAFNLGRVFMFQWTVNWKFLEEDLFLSPTLSIALLLGTLITLYAFAGKWIVASTCCPIVWHKRRSGVLEPEYVALTLFVSNFIGVAFCRSLHYQFYTWYYFSLPFLLWATCIPTFMRLSVMVLLEYAFNTFPATPGSSAALQLAHLTLLAGLWFSPAPRKQLREKAGRD